MFSLCHFVKEKKKSTAQEILFWCAESAPGLFRAQVEVVGFYWCKSDLPSSCHFFIALPWILDVFSSIYHRTQDHVHVWSKWSSKRFRVLQSVSFRKRNWWGNQITWRKLCLFSRKSSFFFYHFRGIEKHILKSPSWKGLSLSQTHFTHLGSAGTIFTDCLWCLCVTSAFQIFTELKCNSTVLASGVPVAHISGLNRNEGSFLGFGHNH